MFNAPYQITMNWFEGVVEDRQDPLKLGRVRVRVFGIHTDNLTKIPTEELHWMQVMHPTTSSAMSGIGETPNMMEGTHVIGFFRDGSSFQDGIVIGTVGGIPVDSNNPAKGFNDTRKVVSSTPGIPENVTFNDSGAVVTESTRTRYPRRTNEPDTSRLARNFNINVATVAKHKKVSQETQKNIKTAGGGTFAEPESPYNAQYPYNQVKETESGHVIELDDTPNAERVHIAHRTGSFIEYHPNGTVVQKAVKDYYGIIHGSSYEHVVGEKTITIDKGAKLLVASKSGNFEIEVGSGGDLNITVDGDFNINCNGKFTVNAEQINLN